MTDVSDKPTAGPNGASWDEFFKRFGREGVPDDFMTEDDRVQGQQTRDPFQGLDHAAWFREQVALGLAEADDPAAEWISNDQAKAAWAEKVAQLKGRIEGKLK
jgi:hypothetical protein